MISSIEPAEELAQPSSKAGGALLGHLFLDDPHLPLIDAREGLIFLRLDSSVQLLVEFGRHLYTKKKK